MSASAILSLMKARDNPLRTERVLQVRFRLDAVEAGLTLDRLMRRWENGGRRGALIGPHGSGKTTLLEDIGDFLATRGETVLHLRLSRDKRQFTRSEWQALHGAAVHTILLFDGAEQMDRLDWARFKHYSRQVRGVMITSHSAGLLPALLECHTSPGLLRDLLHQILGNEAAHWDVKSEALWARHKGDLRLCLRELYDFYGALETVPAPASGENVA